MKHEPAFCLLTESSMRVRTLPAVLVLFSDLTGKTRAWGQGPSMYQGQFWVGATITVFALAGNFQKKNMHLTSRSFISYRHPSFGSLCLRPRTFWKILIRRHVSSHAWDALNSIWNMCATKDRWIFLSKLNAVKLPSTALNSNLSAITVYIKSVYLPQLYQDYSWNPKKISTFREQVLHCTSLY